MENENLIYLKESVPQLVKTLDPDQQPSFGLMTAQHMIEHLIWVTKSSIKDMGAAPEELSDKQKGFMKFVKSGAQLEHRPSNKTKADLPQLRYSSLAEAVEELPKAIDRLIQDYESRGDRHYYNPMMGILEPDEMLGFHVRHYQYHLEKQFGLG